MNGRKVCFRFILNRDITLIIFPIVTISFIGNMVTKNIMKALNMKLLSVRFKGQNNMVEHDNDVVYYFATIEAARQFANKYSAEILFAISIPVVRRDYKPPIYFHFNKSMFVDKLDWYVYTREDIAKRRYRVVTIGMQRSE